MVNNGYLMVINNGYLMVINNGYLIRTWWWLMVNIINNGDEWLILMVING